MIGYAPNGYRLWDKKSRKIIIARDVKFDENLFPYADIENMKPEIDVPLLVRFPFEQEGEGEVEVEAETESEAQNEDVAVPDNHEQVDARESEPEEEFSDALPLQTERPLQESRHSGRERRLPGKLLDYLTGYRATSASLLLPDAPETFAEINGRPDRKVWLKAVEDELRSMDENHVWYFTSCPAGVKPLKSKWIFRVKEDVNGQPVRYKARLVVKGFLQKQGLDYDEIFAPVAKLTTIRIILSAGIHQGFHFHQMDVKTAFLHGELKETIFMEIPDGVDAPPNTVCRLVKSLYGLKQSPRCWNEKFNQKLLELGFKRSMHDYCLYTRILPGDEIYIVLYVDDLLIVGRKKSSILKLKKQLMSVFAMSDCGEANHFLGIKLEYNEDRTRIRLSQVSNIEKMLNRFQMSDCNPVKTPLEKGLLLHEDGESTNEPYRELLGTIMYIMLCTRPDLCFPVSYLGRFQQKPSSSHWKCLKRVVRYLKGRKSRHLEFKRNNDAEILIGYADADWASDTLDRKSVSGYVFEVFGNLVSWSSKKQTTVATSSSEAEYVALSSAASEGIWIAGVLEDLQLKQKDEAFVIYEDNQGCIGMARNFESKRSKHIDIKHHFLRDHIANGRLKIEHVATQHQLADMFTKPMDQKRLDELCSQIGMAD